MTQKILFRFELKCVFDGVEFEWPPLDQPPLVGDTAEEALNSRPIMCPGSPEDMIPPHIEFQNSNMIDSRDTVEVLNYRIESDEK